MANTDFEKDTLQTAKGIIAKRGKKLAGEALKWLAVFLVVALAAVTLVQKGRINKLLREKIPDDNISPASDVIVVPKPDITVQTIREVIAPASKMVSYQYFYTDTGHFKKDKKIIKDKIKLPFTTEEVLYVYSGEIAVGIELGEIAPELDTEGKLLTVKLPALKLLYHELDRDSFECYDVKKSVFTEMNLEDFNEFQKTLMEEQEKKLSAREEFWENARTHTEDVLSGLLSASGKLDGFEIVYQWAE